MTTRKRPKLPGVLTGPVFGFEFAVDEDGRPGEIVSAPSTLLRFCCTLGDHEFLYLSPPPPAPRP